MTEVANFRFTPTAEELYHVGQLGIKLAISYLEGQRRDVSLRLLKFSDFDLSSGQ